MTRRPALGDDAMVRRASLGLAVQSAVLVAAAMLLLVSLVTVFVVRGQTRSSDALLRGAVATADDVGDPPPGAWLVLDRGGGLTSSPGLPNGLGGALAALRAAPTAGTVLDDVTGDEGREYRVATLASASRAVQVVLDLAAEHQQRSLLLRAMGAASLLSLLFAALLGVLLGRRAVRPLAEALSLQRAFVADASHELRTPLTLLSTRAQLLDRAVQAGELDAAARGDAAGVVHDVQRLGEVVGDLLAAADPRAAEQRAPTDLGLLVAAAVDSARAHADAAGVELSCEVTRGPAQVLGSAPALRRAVLSLVDNAIDHTPPGGVVRATVSADRRAVRVTVSDTGPGISPGAARDVFARFHSGGHRAGRPHYGLGLALSHDVANRHGGQLRLLPASVGATFELVLPRPRKDQETPGTV